MSRCTSNTILIPITPNPGVDLPSVGAWTSSGVDVFDTAGVGVTDTSGVGVADTNSGGTGVTFTTVPLVYTIFVPSGLHTGLNSFFGTSDINILSSFPSALEMNNFSFPCAS
jgi:hypothetical protein